MMGVNKRVFHTDRLQFRKYTMDDLPFYASLWGDEKVMRYIGNGTLKTFMQCKKSLEERVLPNYKNGLGLFVMIEKGNRDKNWSCRTCQAEGRWKRGN